MVLGAETDFIKHDADNMVLLGNAHIDNLTHMVIALGAEVWTGQQRVKIIEKLLTTHGNVTTEMIEQYEPTEEELGAWAAERIRHHREADDLGRAVEIAEGILHYPRLGELNSQLKPI